MKSKMKFAVLQNGRVLRETFAVSAADAVNCVRFSIFGLRPAAELGLEAVQIPDDTRPDVSSCRTSASFVGFYPGARRIRRRRV